MDMEVRNSFPPGPKREMILPIEDLLELALLRGLEVVQHRSPGDVELALMNL